jgi:hypothetical protein
MTLTLTLFKRSALVACLLPAAAFASVQFTDGVMDPAQFSAAPLYLQPGTTLTTSQTASGNPGTGLQALTGALTGQDGYSWTAGYIYGGFSYDPAVSGAIAGIDFSLDRAIDFNDGGVPLAGATITARALILQNGAYYMAVSAPVAPTGYVTITMNGLQASDFGLFDFSANTLDMSVHPDFASGAMGLGFAMRGIAAGYPPGDTLTLNGYADNFSMQINAVPEPSAGLLLALGMAAIALRRRSMRG